MKLGIIVDSSSGITIKEAQKRNWGFLPLHIFIDEKDYRDGVDITRNNVYELITMDSEIRTSASSLGEIEELFKKMHKKFDHILVYGLSTGLSSQNNNLNIIAKEYKNIHVVTSYSSGTNGIVKLCEQAIIMAENNKSIKEIIKTINDCSKEEIALMVPINLDWLIKGGRVNSTIAAMANMMKIIPIIKQENGSLHKFGKGRTFIKTIIKAMEIIVKSKKENEQIIIRHSNNTQIKEIQKMLEEKYEQKFETKHLPTIITMHVGIGTVCIIKYKNAIV